MSPSMFPLLLVLSSFLASAQPARTILSLKQEFGRAGFRECRLDIGIEGAGRASVRCVYAGTPATELLHGRALSPEEVTRLLMLVRDSDLFSGGHVGADGTARDGIFETLKVTESGRGTVVLVTSGNSTLMSGSRRTLLNLLHTLLDELMKVARAKQ